MNATLWLTRATQDLPTGVTARVRQDTLNHLHDAGRPEHTDVTTVLGDPEAVNADLKRLYLTVRESHRLSTLPSPWPGWLRVGALLAVAAFLLLEPHSPLAGQGVWSVLFGASVLLLVLATARLHPVRRDRWRDLTLSLIVAVPLMLGHDLLAGVPTLPLTSTLALLISLRLSTQMHLDARIRRTLPMETA
ncbi:hypothetical protein [Deinococcus sedimenti]|uniref:Uncharacterized protein n=1 Tax=Deinococcus sedimenti TaxID=1867090 RepID=A0ABQ2S6P6_9DEIO|nr:hypothetical protein [Deinococcus sedimenti]GGS02266.1 hypothetical protein GCM10008960_31170 [Deinococcus sedimenti]